MSTHVPSVPLDVSSLSPVEDAHSLDHGRDVMTRPVHMPLRDGDPRRAGRYRLTARLGAGGMGLVYLGVGEDGRLVAVKVMRPDLADNPEFRARFSREMAVLARVRGARVVRVIEAGHDACGPFLVTEYAAGPPLERHVESDGPLDPGMLYDLATGLAEALTVIHAAGVVHRDLKPANVILTTDGPKVIDFGIAQALDSVSLTGTGRTVGSTGFMAPEQVLGKAGPAADIFCWALTIVYAAGGELPFGTGATDAMMYRVLYAEPSLAAVPDELRPVVAAALAKEPQDRPAAHEIIDQLTASAAALSSARARGGLHMPTVLSPVPPPADSWSGPPPGPGTGEPGRQLPPSPEPAPAAGGRRRTARHAAVAVPAVVLAAAAALTLALLPGHAGQAPQTAGGSSVSRPLAAGPFGTYAGQQSRGVLQTISRIVTYGNTTVTTGSQVSDSVVRQQFLFSTDGGKTWHRAPVRTADGGQPPLGETATRLTAGPRGWLATGPQGIWTSRYGRSWTQAATHGITSPQSGDQVLVLTSTADGYLAAGTAQAGGAVIWTSRNGLSWQRMTAAQAGLAGMQGIAYAASSGQDTVISGQLASGGSGAWRSTDGGTAWTRVSLPAGYGAGNTISGLAADGSGLIAIRPGTGDAIAYFSPNGLTWQYSATIGAAGGFSPNVVRGDADGFAVTGSDRTGNYVAYTSTGTGPSWLPTGSLGRTASYSSAPIAMAGPGGTVIAAGTSAASKVGQQGVLLRASTSGAVQPVSLASTVIPELSVTSLAVAGGQQIAVGSADGYPAIWTKTARGWTLVSSPSLVSADPSATALTSVTHGPAGWLAVGLGPVVFTSANGTTWQSATGPIARDLGSVVSVAAAGGPRGYVIVGTTLKKSGGCAADVWWSPNLVSWIKAHDVNDSDGSSTVLTVTASANEFVSVGSYDGTPAAWTTTDGRAWTTIHLPLPSGAVKGSLTQVAVQGSRVVALGYQVAGGVALPLAELSTNGGASFRPVPFGGAGVGAEFTMLTAEGGGFTAALQSGAPRQQKATIWTSANGTSWKLSGAAGLASGGLVGGTSQVNALAASGGGAGGAGGAGAKVTAIGSGTSQETAQPVVTTFSNR
jgi:Protein kinase domain